MGELDDSIDIEKMKALTPVGILYLTLERGVDLIEVSGIIRLFRIVRMIL
jgi:hypothetical protein